MKYLVTLENTEVYTLRYLIEANSEEEAIKKLLDDGEGDYIDDEYQYTKDSKVIECKLDDED